MLAAQDEALKKSDRFKLAVSGGSLPKVLGQDLIGRQDVQWDKWLVTRLISLDWANRCLVVSDWEINRTWV